MSPIRVLQICSEFPPFPHGGIGSAVADLAPELILRGVQLEIAGIYPAAALRASGLPETEEREDGLRISRRASRFGFLPFRLRVHAERFQLRAGIRQSLRRARIDLLLCDDYEGPLPFPPPAGTRQIVRLNGSNFVYDALLNRSNHPALYQVEKRTLAQASVWIGVSSFFLRETEARVLSPPNLIKRVIANPVDTALFRASAEARIEGRIVYHNSLSERKGIYDLFAALPEVFERFPDSHLHVLGSCPHFDDTRNRLLESLPASLRGRVSFLGRVDRRTVLPRELAQAVVACYPSHLETFGIAPVEAMAAGCVTIYTDCGPGSEIIHSGRDGFLCPARNRAALASALTQALGMSHEARATMGSAARRTAEERFDRRVVADEYVSLFQQLTGTPTSR